jgi:hypothetical protein
MTAEDVIADLGGETFEVQRAGRAERAVPQPDGSTATAYDAVVRLVRRK